MIEPKLLLTYTNAHIKEIQKTFVPSIKVSIAEESLLVSRGGCGENLGGKKYRVITRISNYHIIRINKYQGDNDDKKILSSKAKRRGEERDPWPLPRMPPQPDRERDGKSEKIRSEL
jgi:hypothetical protein